LALGVDASFNSVAAISGVSAFVDHCISFAITADGVPAGATTPVNDTETKSRQAAFDPGRQFGHLRMASFAGPPRAPARCRGSNMRDRNRRVLETELHPPAITAWGL